MKGRMGEAGQAAKGTDQRRVVGERARGADDRKGGGEGGTQCRLGSARILICMGSFFYWDVVILCDVLIGHACDRVVVI